MKRTLALLLAASLTPLPALAVDLTEPAAGIERPVEPVLPVLPTALAAGGLEMARLKPLEAVNTAAAAQAALTQTAAQLNGKTDSQTLTAAFDAAKAPKAAMSLGGAAVAGGVAAAPTLAPAVPGAYSLWSLARAPRAERWKSPDAPKDWRGWAEEAVHVGGATLMAAFALNIAHAFFGTGAAFGVAAGLAAAMIAVGSAEIVAHLRGHSVQRWQASHDQKYRVDTNTGQLKDVRGHKYGQFSDRFVEHVPGKLSGLETAALRLFGVGMMTVLGYAFGAPTLTMLVANLIATGAFALTDFLPQKDYGPDQTSPDR